MQFEKINTFKETLVSVRMIKEMHVFWHNGCYCFRVGFEAKLNSCH